MTSIKVTQSIIIDPSELGETIESMMGHLFKSHPSGYYLPGHRDPVLHSGRFYYTTSAQGDTPLSAVDSVQGHIFDQDGEIVVPSRRVKQLSLQPTKPYHGIDLVTAVIEHTIDAVNATWRKYTTSHTERSLGEVLRAQLSDLLANPVLDDVLLEMVEKIIELTFDIRTALMEFAGNDRWIMHFQKPWRGSIIVEKTIDYRIYAWEQNQKDQKA